MGSVGTQEGVLSSIFGTRMEEHTSSHIHTKHKLTRLCLVKAIPEEVNDWFSFWTNLLAPDPVPQ